MDFQFNSPFLRIPLPFGPNANASFPLARKGGWDIYNYCRPKTGARKDETKSGD